MTATTLTIPTLGKTSHPSPFAGQYTDDAPIRLNLAQEYRPDIPEGDIFFEPAGPRERLFFRPESVTAAIVTCGGLCPGLNDVIRSLTMQLHHTYHAKAVYGIRYGLEGFIPRYGHKPVLLTPGTVSDIYNFGGTVLGTSRGPQDPTEIVAALNRLGADMLFVIGGDGSMKAAAAISDEIRRQGRSISVVGVPKTIDNDINMIPRSFGFETAVNAATEALACAHTEAMSVPNGIGLVKLMGRESGFIAAQASLSLSIVNFCLIPETRFSLEGEGGLLPALEERLKRRRHALLAVAEGAGQHLMQQNTGTDASGNRILSDIGQFLQEAVKKYFRERGIPITLKYIDPSYMVRSVPADADDRVYCSFLGQNAVHAAMAGKTDMVVAKINDHFVHLPLDIVIKRRRTLDIRSPYWRAVLASTGQEKLKGMLE